MVTLMTPETNKASTGYQEATAVQEQRSESNRDVLSNTINLVVAEPEPANREHRDTVSQQTARKGNLITGITEPLLTLYSLVSGPAMTQRDRNRRALGEATLRDNASFNWLNRAPW